MFSLTFIQSESGAPSADNTGFVIVVPQKLIDWLIENMNFARLLCCCGCVLCSVFLLKRVDGIEGS